jgi:hypothetical protein
MRVFLFSDGGNSFTHIKKKKNEKANGTYYVDYGNEFIHLIIGFLQEGY